MRLFPILALMSVVACNALFGIERASFESTDGGASDSGATADTPNRRADAGADAPDANACVDLLNNPRHCGACGHDCFGGGCVGAVCQPSVVTRHPGAAIFSMAVAGGSIFYLDGTTQTIHRVGITGGASTFFEGASLAGTQLIAHGEHLYFIDGPSVVRCPYAGCSAGAPSEVVRGVAPITFAVDRDGSVVVAEAGTDAPIVRCAKPPCAATELETIASAEMRPANIAVSGGRVAWTLFGSPSGRQALRIGGVGVAPRTLASGDAIFFLAMTPDLIVYGNPNESLMTIRLDGTRTSTLASVRRATEFLTIDGDALIYADTFLSAVMRVPLDGKTAPAPIATGQAKPGAIVTDETSVYWANVDDATILRLAK